MAFSLKIVFAKASSIPRFVRYLVGSSSPGTTQSDFNNNIWWISNGDTTKFGWDNEQNKFFTFPIGKIVTTRGATASSQHLDLLTPQVVIII